MAAAGLWLGRALVQNSPLLVAAEVREVEGKDKSVQTVLSLATAIEEAWLHELFPEDIAAVPRVFYDADTKRVYAEEQLRFRDMAIGARRIEPPPADAAARLLAAEVLAGRLMLNDWDESLEQWILRVNLLSQWCPELMLPPVSDEDRRHLIEQVCHGSFSGKELKDKPAKAIVKSWLSGAQQELPEQARPRAPFPLQRAHGESPVRARQSAAHRPAHPATLRCEVHTSYRDGPRAGAGAYPGAQSAAGANHAGPSRLLARTLPAHQAGAAAQVSATRMALNAQAGPRVTSWNQDCTNCCTRFRSRS